MPALGQKLPTRQDEHTLAPVSLLKEPIGQAVQAVLADDPTPE